MNADNQNKTMSRKEFLKKTSTLVGSTLLLGACTNPILTIIKEVESTNVRIVFSKPMNRESVENRGHLVMRDLDITTRNHEWIDDTIVTFKYGTIKTGDIVKFVLDDGATDLAGNALGPYEKKYK